MDFAAVHECIKALPRYELYAAAYQMAQWAFQVQKLGLLGVFVDGHCKSFGPFNNATFDNHLSWPVAAPKSFVLDGVDHRSVEAYYKSKRDRYGIVEARPTSKSPFGVLLDTRSWWLNGHVVCNTDAPWSTRGLDQIERSVRQAAAIAKYTGAVFFNRRDFPWLPMDETLSAHQAAFPGGLERPAWYGRRPRDAPVFSFYGSSEFHDKLWPPPEHWALAAQGLANGAEPRRSMAVFRGSLTGRFLDARNVRLQLVQLSHKRPDLLDAGLTAWTPRDRLLQGRLEYSGRPSYVDLKAPMSPSEQALYDIVVYAPGHVASSRLGWHLLAGQYGCATIVLDDPSCLAPDMWLHNVKPPGHPSLTEGLHYVRARTVDDLETVLDHLLRSPEGRLQRACIAASAGRWAAQVFTASFLTAYASRLLGCVLE